MPLLTATMIGVSLYGAYQQYASSKDAAGAQAAAALAQAEAKQFQAKELLKRNEMNVSQMRREFSTFKGKQLTSAARQGLSQESTLMALESTNQMMVDRVEFSRIEAMSKAEALRRGADLDTQLSSDISSAGRKQAFAGFVSSVGNTALSYYTPQPGKS